MAVYNFAPGFPPISSDSSAITATPSGTQLTGFALTARYNRVAVCATTADSVTLPAVVTDLPIYVANDGAAACSVYPALGQFIDAAAVNVAKSIPAAGRAVFTGTGSASGRWTCILSA